MIKCLEGQKLHGLLQLATRSYVAITTMFTGIHRNFFNIGLRVIGEITTTMEILLSATQPNGRHTIPAETQY